MLRVRFDILFGDDDFMVMIDWDFLNFLDDTFYHQRDFSKTNIKCYFSRSRCFLIIALALFKDMGILFKIGVSIFYFLVAFFKIMDNF